MKKSTIWLLTIVMAITFGALLYFQIMYLDNMVRMREGQFSENVMRSLSATSSYLERLETLHFLEEEANAIGYDYYTEGDEFIIDENDDAMNASASTLLDTSATITPSLPDPKLSYPSPTSNIRTRYEALRQVLMKQFLYQKGLLDEVILSDRKSVV